MSLFANAKLTAEVAKLGAEIYAILVDKSRSRAEREARIKTLEAEFAEIKKKLESRPL